MKYASSPHATRPYSLHFHQNQNEKKKDKELTERVEKVLKTRDAVLKGADIRLYPLNLIPSWKANSLILSRKNRSECGPSGNACTNSSTPLSLIVSYSLR